MTCFLIWRIGLIVVGLLAGKERRRGQTIGDGKGTCSGRHQERMGGLWLGLPHGQCVWCCKVTASSGAEPCLWEDAVA